MDGTEIGGDLPQQPKKDKMKTLAKSVSEPRRQSTSQWSSWDPLSGTFFWISELPCAFPPVHPVTGLLVSGSTATTAGSSVPTRPEWNESSKKDVTMTTDL